MFNIIFVCLGNICRSPMAEFIMKDLIAQNNLNNKINVSSAGTSGYHDGEDAHYKTKEILKNKNILVKNFCSKKLNEKMCQENNLIIVMDNSNLKNTIKMFPAYKDKIKKLTDYVVNLDYDEVPDPWYSGDFDETYLILSNACANLLTCIKSQHI
ncbi:low molecular weight phosphotyrosine protein phosphatase [Campylobacter insulaenigrae]|uniref:protein-tyrosine-phosphatase n=1 Tax=Campylobacter insulaenigrae TaxID=260714 RepID=A0ABY3G4M6_9BACT|nr:low molecular weight protein-tyrosine-phosphatase [Campylobacter insulaenigrae]MCR6571284.1 low molecular weight phosphotyrosine protein phosphatase [Campylobacter insulaenigrae]MCR6573066.1 low molecular weight phosphotyrosine protein phosphatase [Campylobacter insulaenigrae]MCR6574408.1 low molecular weight phosphotyrosine protein phosphatase [Campylobacter insulaenigrae]MCR6575979.1 low molecular weight phosphotyrosine protein phosphatase [Campylobacter insulaenigrae]MCR6577535.1 low mol